MIFAFLFFWNIIFIIFSTIIFRVLIAKIHRKKNEKILKRVFVDF